jgi:diaminopimelate epimerase
MHPFFFTKYQGTGNDFILVDDRDEQFVQSREFIEHLCHRRFGIGADGLILLQNHPEYDFRMVYYNSDGRESTMCGNGGRCITAFAAGLGLVSAGKTIRFEAADGYHEAELLESLSHGFIVDLKMQDVQQVNITPDTAVLNTGSPHYVVTCDDLENLDIVREARAIRYSERYAKEGININFIAAETDGIRVRTYERGVENETFSCGTGVVASAIAATYLLPGLAVQTIYTKGGNLAVRFEKDGDKFVNVHLVGPAEKVFRGDYTT